jgi:malate synthase
MANYISTAGLQIDQMIYNLVNNDIAPGTGITPEHFWNEFAAILKCWQVLKNYQPMENEK